MYATQFRFQKSAPIKWRLSWIGWLSIVALQICLIATSLRAEGIEAIHIDILLRDDASIVVEQVWETNADSGSEFYISLQNLKQMKLRDFWVIGRDGRPFTERSPWDLNASFQAKSGHYGIRSHDGATELCFGQGAYGPNRYTLHYRLENGVQSFPDRDGFNIRFVNDELTPAPQKIDLRIHLESGQLSPANSEVYAFGFNAPINFIDGELRSEIKHFDASSHVSILLG
ncbi:MAG: hypothetical protein Q4P72_06885, partial [Eubacteriales bacterium]|nr:hypothetical protein [Eubacteriales bacterium]